MNLRGYYSIFIPTFLQLSQNLPRDNNGLEVEFGSLKRKLRIHNGLETLNKMKFISHYFIIKNKQR